MSVQSSKSGWDALIKVLSDQDERGLYDWNAEWCRHRDSAPDQPLMFVVDITDTDTDFKAKAVRHVYREGTVIKVSLSQVYTKGRRGFAIDKNHIPTVITFDSAEELQGSVTPGLGLTPITENPPKSTVGDTLWGNAAVNDGLVMVQVPLPRGAVEPVGFAGNPRLPPPSYVVLGQFKGVDKNAETITIRTIARSGFLMPVGREDVISLVAGDLVTLPTSAAKAKAINEELQKVARQHGYEADEIVASTARVPVPVPVIMNGTNSHNAWWTSTTDAYKDTIVATSVAYGYDPSFTEAQVRTAAAAAGTYDAGLQAALLTLVSSANPAPSSDSSNAQATVDSAAASSNASVSSVASASIRAISSVSDDRDDALAYLQAARDLNTQYEQELKVVRAQNTKHARDLKDAREENTRQARELATERALNARYVRDLAAADATIVEREATIDRLRRMEPLPGPRRVPDPELDPEPRRAPRLRPALAPVPRNGGTHQLNALALDVLVDEMLRLHALEQDGSLDAAGKARLHRLKDQWKRDQGVAPRLDDAPPGSPPPSHHAPMTTSAQKHTVQMDAVALKISEFEEMVRRDSLGPGGEKELETLRAQFAALAQQAAR